LGQEYREKRKQLIDLLAKIPAQGLTAADAKAVAAMRTQLASFSENPTESSLTGGHCQDAQRKNKDKNKDKDKDLDYAALRQSLVACFSEVGGNMSFEGGKINRQTALDLLHETPEPDRRKALFTALGPLWKAINGNNEPDSPYRRMIAMASADGAKNGSEIDRAARDAGVDNAEVEKWLVADTRCLARIDQRSAGRALEFQFSRGRSRPLAGHADSALVAGAHQPALLLGSRRGPAKTGRPV